MKIQGLVLIMTMLTIHGRAMDQCLRTDTLSLDSVTIEAPAWSQSVRVKSGTIALGRSVMDALPRFAGESDYLKGLQWFPNIMVNNEYDTGVYVHGFDASHNDVRVAGAPVYQIGHLLGLFSSFSATHFTSVQLINHPRLGSQANCLGGTLSVEPTNEVQKTFGGELNISPLSAQGTIKCPLNATTSLTLSARTTYLDLLYSQWLKNDDDRLSYGFTDINASLVSDKGQDKYQVNFYYTTDNVGLKSKTSEYDLTINWDNFAVSGRWRHEWNDSISLHQSLLYSSFINNMLFRYASIPLNSPSSIMSWGYEAKFNHRMINCGIEYRGHRIQPQDAISLYRTTFSERDQSAHEASAFTDMSHQFGRWRLSYGIRLNAYSNPQRKWSCHVNPSLTISYKPSETFTLQSTAYLRHQNLFRAGLSSVGLPVEFWFAADSSLSSQSAKGVNVSADWLIADGNYAMMVELYYASLSHQCEYIGDLFQLWDANYDWRDHLAQGKGWNCGAGVIFQKRQGRLTGWLSYSFNKTRRTYNTALLSGSYPSSHDRPHQLKAVASYRFNDSWSVSADYVLTSGTPFTAPASFYIVNGNIVSQYGSYNGNRLPAYKRVDVSASYEVKRKTVSYVVNCTLYNALFLKKPIFYRLKYYNGNYGYLGLNFFMRMLPSVSLSVKF